MSTLFGKSDGQFFILCLKSCAFNPESSRGTCGSVDDSGRIVGKIESKKLEFQKEDLKLVGAESTSVMPDEMENLVKEPPRDSEIVALFKRISDECMIARPDLPLLWLLVSQRFKASEPLRCPSNRTLASPGCSRSPLHAASPISPSRNTVRPLSIRA